MSDKFLTDPEIGHHVFQSERGKIFRGRYPLGGPAAMQVIVRKHRFQPRQMICRPALCEALEEEEFRQNVVLATWAKPYVAHSLWVWSTIASTQKFVSTHPPPDHLVRPINHIQDGRYT